MKRKVRLGEQELTLKVIVKGKQTAGRFPCCRVPASVSTSTAQRVECPRCRFPWRVRRKGKAFDWTPDSSRMRRSMPPGVTLEDISALVSRIVSESVGRVKKRRPKSPRSRSG